MVPMTVSLVPEHDASDARGPSLPPDAAGQPSGGPLRCRSVPEAVLATVLLLGLTVVTHVVWPRLVRADAGLVTLRAEVRVVP